MFDGSSISYEVKGSDNLKDSSGIQFGLNGTIPVLLNALTAH